MPWRSSCRVYGKRDPFGAHQARSKLPELIVEPMYSTPLSRSAEVHEIERLMRKKPLPPLEGDRAVDLLAYDTPRSDRTIKFTEPGMRLFRKLASQIIVVRRLRPCRTKDRSGGATAADRMAAHMRVEDELRHARIGTIAPEGD